MIEIVKIEEPEVTDEQAMEAIHLLRRYCEQHKHCAQCYLDNGAACVISCPFLWKIVEKKGKKNEV